MKNRILKNWTFARGLYLAMGIVIIIQSVINQEWFGIIFGGYFASMGLFAFGCASGNCFGGKCEVNTKDKNNPLSKEITFEEVK
jgi:hypothetical protein